MNLPVGKRHTVIFDRTEVTWLYRKCKMALDHAEEIMRAFTNKQPELSSNEKEQLSAAQEGGPFLLEMTRSLEGLLNDGAKERMGMEKRKVELTNIIDLAEEEVAKSLAKAELSKIPADEPYKMIMSRDMVKFFLDMVEKDINNIQFKVIPNYQQQKDDIFTDPMMPKSFYINKNKKQKTVLEIMRAKLEKVL